ncbi:MAG: serine/threonine protein kinase [Azoarcus sp.]|jgi:serine/threonine protein kinase|nr:serine/threonine protein kinase [Azoarcus sp.]
MNDTADARGAEMPAPMSALPAGTRLQEFVIRSVIGEGGFGIVYLAHDTFLDREVAIKEYLPASLAARGGGAQVEVRVAARRELFVKGMRRFVNEAHILARFRHPALVSVLRFLEANGTAYMVMPYYRGTTLRDMVRAGYRARSSEDLLAILIPVLGGLAQIHSVDCYHLDISSDNILMLENKMPVLLDFGAARHTELGGEDPTTIILKPGFAPIEQYGSGGGSDNAPGLGPWTDIYALSVVAYFLVSGAMPGISVARIMRDTVKPLAAAFASPALPAGVLKIIDAGMAVRPQERPRTVEAFRQALLDAAEETAPPVLTPARAPSVVVTPRGDIRKARGAGTGKGSRDNDAVMRWSILLLVLLLFVTVFFIAFSGGENTNSGAAAPTPSGARGR